MRITGETWGKLSTASASSLDASEKCLFKPGEYKIVNHRPTVNNHRVVTFPIDYCGRKVWAFFDDHVDCEGEGGQSYLIKQVPYYSQRDNPEQSWRVCNSSSCAMLAQTLKPGCLVDDYQYWVDHVNPYGDSPDHNIQTAALQRLGIRSEWRTNLDYVDIDRSLALGIPMVIGVYHKGSLSAPTGGHILVIVGKDFAKGKEVYTAKDPWGEGFDGNYEANHNGDNVRYPVSSLSVRWGGKGAGEGWGRIVTAIDGKPTGL
jgi:hypothetical protein